MSPKRVRNIGAERIDEYARSMFRFEHLHDRWIEKCSQYVRRVFGPRLAGATVVDYAFGRGNWAVAFARAGAKRVIAIDASRANVARFSGYCRQHGLRQVEPVLGNILAKPFPVQADIVWVYGILPCIPEAGRFASELASMVAPRGELLAYAYDKGSLRELVVEAARSVAACPTEESFRAVSYFLAPAARLRARDDLTAPYIRWHEREELASLFDTRGLFLRRSVSSFQEFLGERRGDAEFSPHHLVFSRSGPGRTVGTLVHGAPSPDLEILRGMTSATLLRDELPRQTRRALALGLLNTHFTALEKPGGAAQCAVDDFLFLLYATLTLGIDIATVPGGAARDACRWALKQLRGEVRQTRPKRPGSSAILRRLASGPIRL